MRLIKFAVGFQPARVWEAMAEEYGRRLGEKSRFLAALGMTRKWKVRVGAKRLVDVAVAGAALVLLAPVMAAVALAIWICDGRPLLFRQSRPGYRGEPFTLLKFRTMREVRDERGRPQGDGERLTEMGRWLRELSLDELPQLWNVLRGEMSLVGPRPLLMEYLGRYSNEEMRRHEVKPGITGWAQIHGRNATSWRDRFVLDVWYVEHWSLELDARILLSTPWRIFSKDGIARQGHATMPEFWGSERGGEL
jgi:sugar transferase EpsL